MKRRRSMVIVKVRRSRASKQKTVTVPKSAAHIRAGDYVELRKVRGGK